MLPEGQYLDHYRLVSLLKSGGMGEIYLAEDLLLDRQVAIKVIQANQAYFTNADVTREGIRLFLREARAAAQLDHPHILPLYDCGEIAIRGVPLMYMVMPLRQEGSLAEWLENHSQQPISLQEIAKLVQQAAVALQHAHDHQIVHQDVKPANFLIRERRREHEEEYLDLQLTDFGIAKLLQVAGEESEVPRGTPAYVAPEQWDSHPVPASDQYALAVMTYELLTGDVPFTGTQDDVLYQHLYILPRPASEINPHLPASVDAVLLRALRKQPAERYPSVSAFARAFQRALQENGALYQTVSISPAEAQEGTYRTLNLSGRRRVVVDIPPGVVHGEIMKFKGIGEPGYGGQPGSLILTVNVEQEEDIATLPRPVALPKTAPPVYPAQHTVPPRVPINHSGTTLTWLFTLAAFLVIGSGSLFYFTQAQAMNAAYARSTVIAQAHWAAITVAQGATSTANTNSNATGTAAQTTVIAKAATETKKAADVTTTASTQANLTATASTTAATATARASQAATETAVAGTNATATAGTQVTATTAAAATTHANAALASTYATTTARGVLQFDDPLQDNGLGYRWDEISVSGGGCAFTNQAYHSRVSQSHVVSPCFARATDYRNFFYQVNMQIVNGDQGGLIFYADAATDTFYYFHVAADGSYALEIYKQANAVGTLQQGKSEAIKTGLNQNNLLAVSVEQGRIDLYINMQLVTSVNDTTLAHGQVGVVAEDVSHPTEVAFSNARVRTF
jgi:eukaryotic-like serine/threonine-protein kinase